MAGNKITFDEFYGVRNLMIAPITIADDGTETWGTPQRLAGVQAISSETSESSETHYYDNQGAVVVSSEGDDTYTLTVSVVNKKTRALIEGTYYDEATGALIGTPKNKQYFAMGFIGNTVNNVEEFVWVYKGKFTGGAVSRNTRSDSPETTNMEYTFTSIATTKEFGAYGTAKYIMIDNTGLLDENKFFAEVIEPDHIADAQIAEIGADVLTVPTGSEEDFYGKNPDELMSGVSVKENGAVTGTLLYVTGYTGFNASVPAEQEGHYFAFTLTKSGTLMTFRKNGIVTKSNIAWEADNVFRIDNTSTTFDVLVDGELVVSFNFRNATLA